MNNQEGGYECEFVETPPKCVQSECPVCLLVLREPHQVDCCGYVFCQVCIEKVKRSKQPCPCCNKKFEMFEDKRLKRSLNELPVYCINKEQGCQWVGDLGQLDNHLNSNPTKKKQQQGCQFCEIKCVYCHKYFPRYDIQLHQNNNCPKRPFRCEFCNDFKSSYKNVTTIHWPVCECYPMPCPNKCGKTLQRRNLDGHIADDCPLTIIACDFQHVGCEIRLKRKDMSTHLQKNLVQHVSLQVAQHTQVLKYMALQTERYKQIVKEMSVQTAKLEQVETKMSQLEEENKHLKLQLVKMTQDLEAHKIGIPICPVEFIMTEFEQKKQKSDIWYSPSFYEYYKGYKMHLCVNANGYGSAKDTHISAFIQLRKGVFDEHLKWPFRYKVHIRLLNQEDNRRHRKVTINFNDPEAENSGDRVREEDQQNASYGLIKCFSHSELKGYYLKNDCLKFRITVS